VPKVSQYYQLPTPVPFVDVRLEQDNRLFIEPSAIRAAARAGSRYAVEADQTLTSFFDQVLTSVRSTDIGRGLDLLTNLHEPNETRLGMTRIGVAGHGMGVGLARDLWKAMHANPACRDAILVGRLEDLAPYVDGVGPDLVSDLSTRVAFGVLADFTTEMIATFPALGRSVSTETERVWDIPSTSWISRSVSLPVVDGKRLLLVPTNWVWPRQLINAPSFYQVQALGRIQERLTQPPRFRGGRPTAPTKKMLRRDHPEVRPTNISQAIAAAGTGVSLTARHTEHVQSRFEDLQLQPNEVNALI